MEQANEFLKTLISALLTSPEVTNLGALHDEIQMRGYTLTVAELEKIVRDLASASSKVAPQSLENDATKRAIQQTTTSDMEGFVDDVGEAYFEEIEGLEDELTDEPGSLEDRHPTNEPSSLGGDPENLWLFGELDDDFFDQEVLYNYTLEKLDKQESQQIEDVSTTLTNARRLGLQGKDIERYAYIVATPEVYEEIRTQVATTGLGLDWHQLHWEHVFEGYFTDDVQ